MKIGTKSLLFGVHAFWWHPIVVWRAYRALYGETPGLWKTLAIVLHDVGYWGCQNMDGAEGKDHPYKGANWVFTIMKWCGVPFKRCGFMFMWTASHSRHLAKVLCCPPSALCWADKASIVFEPAWFYLLRARLSGEIKEFKINAVNKGLLPEGISDEDWLEWLQLVTVRQCAQALGETPGIESVNSRLRF